MRGCLLLISLCLIAFYTQAQLRTTYPVSESVSAPVEPARLTVTIRLIDAEVDTMLANGRLVATDERTGQVVTSTTDRLGFKLSVHGGTTLLVAASAPAYLPAKTRIPNLAVSQQVIVKLTHTKPSILTIKAFAVNISMPLSPATAIIRSLTSGKVEQFELINGRLQQTFAKPDKLEIQVSSPGYIPIRRQMSIDVAPTGNRYEFDAELDKNVDTLSARPVSVQSSVLSTNIASVSAVATKAFGVIEKGKTIRLNKIYFDQSSPVLRPESFVELDQLYDLLIQYPSLRIEIRGYTDNQGDFDLNTQLSRERCRAVVDYLSKKGIRRTRLNAVGRGPLDPVAPNNNEENRSKNRRVEFVLL